MELKKCDTNILLRLTKVYMESQGYYGYDESLFGFNYYDGDGREYSSKTYEGAMEIMVEVGDLTDPYIFLDYKYGEYQMSVIRLGIDVIADSTEVNGVEFDTEYIGKLSDGVIGKGHLSGEEFTKKHNMDKLIDKL